MILEMLAILLIIKLWREQFFDDTLDESWAPRESEPSESDKRDHIE